MGRQYECTLQAWYRNRHCCAAEQTRASNPSIWHKMSRLLNSAHRLLLKRWICKVQPVHQSCMSLPVQHIHAACLLLASAAQSILPVLVLSLAPSRHQNRLFLACSSGGDVEASPASNQGHQAAVNQTGSPALAEVQGRLRSFLKQSSRYDARLVLARIRGTPLWQEQVILHSKVCSCCAYLVHPTSLYSCWLAPLTTRQTRRSSLCTAMIASLARLQQC